MERWFPHAFLRKLEREVLENLRKAEKESCQSEKDRIEKAKSEPL
jgi:hypothetical protein